MYNVSICPVTDILATVTPMGVKFCVMVHIGPRHKGDTPKGYPKSQIFDLHFGHLTTNISKTVSRNVTCQLELNISSTGPF